jgi:hypothetical protein
MTQPVSRGARWLDADLTCSEPSREESETLTCEEPRDVSCAPERAHRIVATEPRRDAGASDGAAPGIDMPHDGGSPSRSDAPRRLGFCERADTVVEGFLCNDAVTVSNACRKPTNAFDEFVCDEPRMQRLQWSILRETWAFVKAIAIALVRKP